MRRRLSPPRTASVCARVGGGACRVPTHGAAHEACENSLRADRSRCINRSRHETDCRRSALCQRAPRAPGDSDLEETRSAAPAPAPFVRLVCAFCALSQHASAVRTSRVCHASVMRLAGCGSGSISQAGGLLTGLIRVRSVSVVLTAVRQHSARRELL